MTRRAVLIALIGIGLFVTGCCVDWLRLTFEGLDQSLNDQVGYISVARHWLDDGRLDSSIIYPSLLTQNFNKNSLYMPGFYTELAATFRVLGYSAWSARLPALVSFMVASGLVYWAARRLFDPQTASLSTLLFAFFPMNLFYAFTAMAEIPLVAAGLVSFVIFLATPERFRWWVGPLALALPILFRETGVALALLMCTVLFFSATKGCKKKAGLCGLFSGVVLLLLVLSPAGAGRPSMWKANILAQGRFETIYTDAFAWKELPDSSRDWLAAIGLKFASNTYSLFRGFASAEGLVMSFLLTGIPLGLWFWAKRRLTFALGVALTLTCLLAADLCLYTVWHYRGIRMFLLMEPFVAMLWGAAMVFWLRNCRGAIGNLLVPLAFLLGLSVTVSILLTEREATLRAEEDTLFLESIVGNRKQLLVSPWWLSLDYVNQHYPQRWAFVPANCPTMELLDKREVIGTLVLPAEPARNPGQVSCGIGVTFKGERVWRGARFWIYRRE